MSEMKDIIVVTIGERNLKIFDFIIMEYSITMTTCHECNGS